MKMAQFRNKGNLADLMNNEMFDDIFRQYSRPLFYYAAKFVGNESAKDIVQDLFAKIWSDHTIVVNKSLNALLFTAIRNLCLQHLEKQKVRHKYVESTKLILQREELDYYMAERSSLIEQELEDRLNEVLNALPARCRQIFLLSRFEDKKNREIAYELKISVKAVEKQISKALSTIRKEMKDYLPLLAFLF